MLYIGIDLGTSAVKLLLADEKGEIKKTATRSYPLEFPQPGWSQQDPQAWYDQTMDGLKELLADCDRSRVAGIGFGGQMHGLVVLDQDDRIIRPAILWNDGRTQKQTDWLNGEVGRNILRRETGNIAFAGFTAPKLLWLKENEPENFARIKKIMLPKDYLCYRLCGAFTTDASDASGTLLFDVKNRRWSAKMCQICGITEAQLPAVCESYDVVGELLPSCAAELGLPSGVRVVAGAGDNAAAAVGTGTVGDGACNISLGTSGTIFLSAADFRMDDNNALHSFAHADGRYHLMGCMLSAASCNHWWMDEILRDANYEKAQEEIGALGENTVYFLPYLMGERSPHNDPLARACFLGMTMDTGRKEMLQAVLEGVAFAVRDSLEVARAIGCAPTATRICGGGAKSALWRRMIANILNMRVEIPAVEEGPAFGAILLAAVGCGEYPSVEEAARAVTGVRGIVEPEAELVERYEKRYDTFRRLYPALKEVFPLMTGTEER